MMNNNAINTISVDDVMETLQTASAWGLKPEVEEVVFDFASELTGMSTDKLMEMLDTHIANKALRRFDVKDIIWKCESDAAEVHVASIGDDHMALPDEASFLANELAFEGEIAYELDLEELKARVPSHLEEVYGIPVESCTVVAEGV